MKKEEGEEASSGATSRRESARVPSISHSANQFRRVGAIWPSISTKAAKVAAP
uniref:Uncharacterized protein n=1 Tax=Arundo donax TaxID=35708 RepID=A0A0A9HQK5_ARUDO